MFQIDWSFIRAREGFTLTGYVPDPEHSNSGVTVATGVDVGHLTPAERLALPADLYSLLDDYFGVFGVAAQKLLEAQPLTITQTQADQLDARDQSMACIGLSALYGAWSKVMFQDLPPCAQTCIMSVYWQYGDLPKETPKFFAAVIKQDWQAAYEILLNFHDDYQSRHDLEAALLKPLLPAA